ncbi:MAG: hypothetical protein IT457_14115 [Planctomycetes bacterium]|nr:hypothetical protein [Planctomycetota bacterium]
MSRATAPVARVALELALLGVAIAAVLGATRGLGAVVPGLANALRLLFHPLVLLALATAFVLLRWRRPRPKGRNADPGRTQP